MSIKIFLRNGIALELDNVIGVKDYSNDINRPPYLRKTLDDLQCILLASSYQLVFVTGEESAITQITTMRTGDILYLEFKND